MTINIIMSDTSSSDAFVDQLVAFGEISTGNDSDEQDIFIRHDAQNNPITDCAWYITRYVGSDYPGSDADADITEVLGWGDAATGGLLVNQTIPVGWTVGTPFGSGTWQRFRNGYGDTDNQLILDEDSINIGTPAGDGVIPVGGEAHVQIKMQIPSSVSSAGQRGVLLVFAFSSTS